MKRTRILVLAIAVGAALSRAPTSAAATAPAKGKEAAHIVAYGAYGTTDGLMIRGRVERGQPVPDKPWRGSLRRSWVMAGAFTNHSLHFAHVRLRDTERNCTIEVRADDSGYFQGRMPGPLPLGVRAVEVS